MGCLSTSLPYFAAAALLMTKRVLSLSRNTTLGLSVTRTMVWSSTTRISTSSFSCRRCRLFLSVLIRLNENSTSCAVSGVPSWNLIPLRSLNTHSLPFNSQDSASLGTYSVRSSSNCTSGSMMCSQME